MGHVAVVDSDGGYIILYNSTLARKTQQPVQHEVVNEHGAIRLYQENGTYIGETQIQQQGSTRGNQELCSMDERQQSGAFGTLTSVCKAHSCPLAPITRNEAANHAY